MFALSRFATKASTTAPTTTTITTAILRRLSQPPCSHYLYSPRNMATATETATATPYQMHLSPQDTGLWKVKQTEEAAKKASELLQKDLEKHHVFFNNEGFHNHITHHILTLYGTGAGPDILQKGYDANTGYQRPTMPAHERVVEDLFEDWDHAKQYIGKEKHYPDFLRFFQKEIEKKGWQAVLAEYAFTGTAAADDLLARLYAGAVHPLIQLMYGMEWDQPAVVAQALAQASVHDDRLTSFLLDAEKEARAAPAGGAMPPIPELLAAVRADPELAGAVRPEHVNKIRDGVFAHARSGVVKAAARVRVAPEDLDATTAEMYNSALYMTVAPAVHPPKHPKIDFFLMHHVNVSPIFLTINAQPWIPTDVKVRLLEWKIRLDLLEYIARAVPPLSIDAIATYKPKDESRKSPADVFSSIHRCHDDGHAIKLGRAAALCQQLSKKYEDGGRLPIKGDKVWTNVYHLILDSITAPGPTWVRTAGLEDAWNDVPDAKL